jgi:hypothetical protein
MFDIEISDLVFGKLNALGFKPSDIPDHYSFSSSFKETLAHSAIDKQVKIISSSHIEIILSKSDYLNAIITDIHFGKVRVEKQIESIQGQLKGNDQVAWVLVSTYYACYFLCNEISKISGQFITNLSPDGLARLISFTEGSNTSIIDTTQASAFAVSVSLGENENEVRLDLTKTGAKPHKVAWTNISGILRQIRVTESKRSAKELLEKIVGCKEKKWMLPSELRNEWNYSATHYYGETGCNRGKQFLYLMNNLSSYKWARKIGIKPTDENQVSSLAYVYECLSSAHTRIIKRLDQV